MKGEGLGEQPSGLRPELPLNRFILCQQSREKSADFEVPPLSHGGTTFQLRKIIGLGGAIRILLVSSVGNGGYEPNVTDAALCTNVGYIRLADIGGSKTKEDRVAIRTEYLIIQYARDSSTIKELRAPKSVNLRLLLERLICQDLDDNAVISSCLRSNAKRFHDPFQVIDMREEHRREQARDALNTDPETDDPIGVYTRAWAAQIPLGKTLMIAGTNHDYFVNEVEV
jgi:hypothetical protein